MQNTECATTTVLLYSLAQECKIIHSILNRFNTHHCDIFSSFQLSQSGFWCTVSQRCHLCL